MRNHSTINLLERIAREYPQQFISAQLHSVRRIAFELSLIIGSQSPRELSLCDLGGGLSMLSLACAALGFSPVYLIDDFDDPVNRRAGDGLFDLHRRYGVHIIRRDLIREGIGEFSGKFAAISCIDSMEHWHHSPKRLFHQVMHALRPGGKFILGTPNCVNLRKRIAWPLGLGRWTAMKDWYEPDVFRGHVREPSIRDLRYIARDMGLCKIQIVGRSWAGMLACSRTARIVARVLDYPLRLRPSLCSDLYLVGHKCSVSPSLKLQ